MGKKIIGLNVGHDGGCSLCVDGKIVFNMAEERLNRMKNSYGWTNSLKLCLEKNNLNISDVDLIVFSDYNDKIENDYDGGLAKFGYPKKKCIRADHHLSHACATFFSSGFEESLIYILDGRGNNNSTESIYIGKGTQIKKIGGNPNETYMKGLVAAYQAFTAYFGWHQDEAGKTMGLAPYGDSSEFNHIKLFEKTVDGWWVNRLPNNTAKGLETFCKDNNLNVPAKFSKESLIYANMAAWLQTQFEEASIDLINRFALETGIKNVCMAGGGALNSVTNRKILDLDSVENLFIFPASGDSGQSIGNALYGYYIHEKHERKIDTVWKNDYRSVTYSNEDIESMLARTEEICDLIIPKTNGFTYEKLNNITLVAAELISKGNIIGWFQGASEIGPRALGHRSILCDPRPGDMKDKLNDKVKHRESFRPFAASVLAEDSPEYFDLNISSPFMLLVVDVKKKYHETIAAVTHFDGTCRIQTVTKEENGNYYDLINDFKQLTGVPLVLNTSFNLAGEPIVETPFDALRCFLRTEMDYLILGDYLVTKR